MPLPPDEVQARARRVRLLLLDVDGVLTDGTVTIDAAGGEQKAFHIRDGLGIVWARREGLEVGFLSGRPSPVTERRAEELGVRIVSQPGPDKVRGYLELIAERHLDDADVAYMGDDLLDLPIFRRVGLTAAPADAVEDVRARAHWVSRHGGGRGAVREFVELLLAARGSWPDLVRTYVG
jgi:3-deoxy-D-manno-octulosonate 8-phosphate phosphatase (KDO 8-P phosphatase)